MTSDSSDHSRTHPTLAEAFSLKVLTGKQVGHVIGTVVSDFSGLRQALEAGTPVDLKTYLFGPGWAGNQVAADPLFTMCSVKPDFEPEEAITTVDVYYSARL